MSAKHLRGGGLGGGKKGCLIVTCPLLNPRLNILNMCCYLMTISPSLWPESYEKTDKLRKQCCFVLCSGQSGDKARTDTENLKWGGNGKNFDKLPRKLANFPNFLKLAAKGGCEGS